jgi:hypothetical protein
MINRLLVGVGLFALGYLVGKAVGRTDADPRRQLTWERQRQAEISPETGGADADFDEPRVHRTTDSRVY